MSEWGWWFAVPLLVAVVAQSITIAMLCARLPAVTTPEPFENDEPSDNDWGKPVGKEEW